MSLLKVKNLSIGFHSPAGYSYKVVRNISFELEKGEVLGIVGESGSGKSLTALSILGLLPYPRAFHSAETSIMFAGTELIDNPHIQEIRGKKIGFVFQEPMSSLNPLQTIGRQISEALLTHKKISVKQAHAEAMRLLSLTGIANPKRRFRAYPHELSGGQRQRVMIAMAIANRPDILIADEPTTALDVTIAAQILELLLKLKEELGMAVIFISHDLNIVRRIADKVLVMKGGKIVERGSCENIFRYPKNSYTKALICSSNILKKNSIVSRDMAASIQHLAVRFPVARNFFGKIVDYFYAVNGVSLTIKEGKTLGLVGESGSGKTTLGLAMAGLIESVGKIFVKGQNIRDISHKELHKKIQIVFQDPYTSLNPRMNVSEIVGEGIKVHFPQLSKKEKDARICQVLQEVGLKSNCLEKYPHEFSGGQRQRIAIARALVVEPEILILDEPTSALDVTIAAQILKLLQKIQETRGISYLFISHDMRAVRALADDIAVMKDGKIIEFSSATQLFENPKQTYTRRLIYSADLEKKERRGLKQTHKG